MKPKPKLTKKCLECFMVANQRKILCDKCEKEMTEYSMIKITTYDNAHCYKGSGRRFIMNYKLRLCEKCFLKKTKEMEAFIIN